MALLEASRRAVQPLADAPRRRGGRIRHADSRESRPWRGRLLPRGARRSPRLPAARPPRPEGADLREHAWSPPARCRRRDVQREAQRAGTDPRGPDHALARAPRLRSRREPRSEATQGWLVPEGATAPPGQRDAAPLVHERSAERIRDPRSRAGAVSGRDSPAGSLSGPRQAPRDVTRETPALAVADPFAGRDRAIWARSDARLRPREEVSERWRQRPRSSARSSRSSRRSSSVWR